MQTTTLLTLLATLTTTLAAPQGQCTPGQPGCPGTPPRPKGIIRADVLSTYNVNTGATDYDVQYGHVQKGPWNSGIVPTTTLATFTFPESTAGQECEFHFDIDAATGVATGSQRAQLFTSLEPAEGDTTGWPSGNLRDSHMGDLKFEVGKEAVWEGQYSEMARGKFPCPAGKRLAGELVGRWDEVEISWDHWRSGPYFLFYDKA